MAQRAKTIGILGGMGPAATVEFFRRLVVATPAATDQEHLHIVIDNDPAVPDRTRALLHGGPSPVGALVAMARRLEGVGADVLAMPCNTAHAYLDAIREAVALPVVDMVGETVASIDAPAAGLLATDGTIESGLYRSAGERYGLRIVVPSASDRRSIMAAIAAIKRGEPPASAEPAIREVGQRLLGAGAVTLMAACTELSLVSADRVGLPWVDALDRLVEATLREAGASGATSGGKEAE